MIETARLLLRNYTPEDFSAQHAILSDLLTMQFWPRPFDENATRSWLDRSIKSYIEHGFGRMAVIHRESGSQIGNAGIMKTEVNGIVEVDLGYIIHSSYWRQGYGLEAAQAVLNFAKESGQKRVVANMAYDHIASQRVAERLGMKKEKEFINSRNRGILTYLYVAEP